MDRSKTTLHEEEEECANFNFVSIRPHLLFEDNNTAMRRIQREERKNEGYQLWTFIFIALAVNMQTTRARKSYIFLSFIFSAVINISFDYHSLREGEEVTFEFKARNLPRRVLKFSAKIGLKVTVKRSN